MTLKVKVIIGVIAVVTAYAFGRWSAPEKIVEVTKTVEVERKDSTVQKESDRNRRKETTKTEVTRPDGTVEKTENTVETTDTHSETDKRNTTDTTKNTETLKEVTVGSAKVTIGALGAARFSGSSPVTYGLFVSRPILGPITVGVFGLADGTIGGMLGLTF